MTKNKNQEISPFGEAALALDREFLQKERLSRELERLSQTSDRGMARSETLLADVDACRERMAIHMQAMVKALEEARQRNDAAEKLITERAAEVQERQKEAEKLLERFKRLAEMTRQITASNVLSQDLKGKSLSPEQRELISSHLPEIDAQLNVLVQEADLLMKDSRQAQAKTLERNAESIRQNLQNLRVRLSTAATLK